jgi:hypothetical protein
MTIIVPRAGPATRFQDKPEKDCGAFLHANILPRRA